MEPLPKSSPSKIEQLLSAPSTAQALKRKLPKLRPALPAFALLMAVVAIFGSLASLDSSYGERRVAGSIICGAGLIAFAILAVGWERSDARDSEPIDSKKP